MGVECVVKHIELVLGLKCFGIFGINISHLEQQKTDTFMNI
jgi:hypothetical protein